MLNPRLSVGPLHDESTPLDSVDDDEAGWEERVMAPSADKLDAAAAGQRVVLGVDVEVTELGDAGSTLVGLERGDVNHVQAGAVVALVRDAVDDVLVVVNTLGVLVAEVAREDGRLERGDVPKVRDREAVCTGASRVVLIVLVVLSFVSVLLRCPK